MVTLIGAGPGDAGLLTVKGMKRLLDADVVLFDRLVSREIIEIIPESAEKIDVGKNAGRHPVPQNEINEILLSKALEGLNIVRLKGGDPFVFGRGGEELELLAQRGVEFEVVPGISSSIAGAAYAGIPVTHRDFTSSLHIITGHKKENGKLEIDYESLVKLNGTLVFMMSVSSLPEISKGLISAGIDCEMPAAVIENATTVMQRKFIGTIESIPEIAKNNNVISPAVIIVGKVCSLSDELDWFSNKPLLGKKIVVTRSRTNASALSEKLRELGCDVYEIPCIKIVPLVDNNKKLDDSIARISEYGWLIFTSAVGVKYFFDYFKNRGLDIRTLLHLKIAAVGSETQKEIEKYGIFVDYIPEEYNGKKLAEGLVPLIKGEELAQEKVLIARAKIGTEEIPQIFDEEGIAYDDIAIYDTSTEINQNESAIEMLINNDIDLVTFTSSSTVEGFVKTFPEIEFDKINGLCIGKKTQETAIKYGIKTTISDKSTIDSMIEKIKEMWINGN